jgi:hypothetical protein
MDNQRHIIFIHMEKTGGTSIARAIWGHEKPLSDDKSYDNGLTKHYSADKARACCNAYRWQHNLRFTVVRNPWDRLVSKWWWRHNGILKKGEKPLPEMLRLTPEGKIPAQWFIDEFEEERRRWNLHTDTPTDEFLFGLTNEGGMSCGTGEEPCVHEVLRFESLQQDWGKLIDKYPVKFKGCKRELPHCNKTDNRDWDYRVYYTAETVELVAASCPKIIQYFNYTFSDD